MEEKNLGWRYDLFEWLQIIVTTFATITLCFSFFFTVFAVSGTSMYPTLNDGDLMFVQRIGYTAKQGDVVIVRKEGFPDYETHAIVKRVIATGGQTVYIDYDENKVYVDGEALDEDYLNFDNIGVEDYGDDYMLQFYGMDEKYFQEFTVPEGQVFVMGDNRNNSADSRFESLGCFDEDYIVGHAIFVFFPFGDLKILS